MRRSTAAIAVCLLTMGCGSPLPNAGSRPSSEPVAVAARGQTPSFEGQTRAPERKSGVSFDVIAVAKGLEHPWGVAFLPSGSLVVTERPGRIRIVSPDGTLSPAVEGVPRVYAWGQGGLLDVALDPAFSSSRLVYWSYAEPRGWFDNATAVARGRLIETPTPRLENVQVIFRQEPSLASPLHFGGRLVFRPDGTLFVTLGERSSTEGRMQAQRLDGLLGKIVRIQPDGSVPKDNPFVGQTGARPEIWSIGHRNIQGAALHPETGELWEVEHGAHGGDEVNIARAGRDYGWPTITYGVEYSGRPITGGIQQQDGMEQPLYYWDPVIAPSGMLFYTGDLFPAWRGNLFIGGLASQQLTRLTLDGERVVDEERLLEDMPDRERIRDVRQGPDGAIYLLTDNANGRVLRLVPRR